ncbi:MlaD family protein [Mycobacterium avium]|uniref:MlaD family protein n=1 Tax=Mycobacterium avium TaxID=1764 RepID=UPI001CC4F4DE|nr:MlaD family protein [Mycobacterium avium]MBZ4521814.1 MCE family protein [Mycobacterium avium subsp. hominissuis]MBZ4531174.1 MCE family protein [Mycobacterium avium subsp. hominissuis]
MGAPALDRIARTAATALAAAAVAVTAGSCAPLHQSYRAEYCAIMPDSVGLYPGNTVTQMGYGIGTVTSINPGSTQVRVDFTVTTDRRLPRDVKAIIRSTSVLADRSLELVGNPGPGPKLPAGECIPLSHSFTPKSLSEVIGTATNFINSINPDGSTNVGDAVRGIDQAIHGNGAGINHLLTTTSAVLDSPDEAVSDIGSIIRNLAQLTSLLRELRGPMKQILLDAHDTMPDVLKAAEGGERILTGMQPFLTLLSDLEIHLGETTQFTLDATSMAVRKLSAHARRLANLLNPVPWWINSLANIANNHQWGTLRYRPPLYRIRTPDGVALCNIMNAKTPGSCANVQGTPYAVDVSLLQYVLTQAANR